MSSRASAGSGNLGISTLRKPDGSVSVWPLIKGRGALAPLDYYYAPGCGGVRMVKRFMLTPCWAGGINSGTVLTPPQTGATRWCESKAYMSSAVTEPLEPLLRALFGHSRRTLPMIAVTEPLEPTLRAQFGQSIRTLPMIAVTEPLEPPLRPQFGHSRRSLPIIAVIEPLEPPLRAQFGRSRKTCL